MRVRDFLILTLFGLSGFSDESQNVTCQHGPPSNVTCPSGTEWCETLEACAFFCPRRTFPDNFGPDFDDDSEEDDDQVEIFQPAGENV